MARDFGTAPARLPGCICLGPRLDLITGWHYKWVEGCPADKAHDQEQAAHTARRLANIKSVNIKSGVTR